MSSEFESRRIRMQKCKERGCRNLEWRCKDCGQVASSATFSEEPEWIVAKDEMPKKDTECLVYHFESLGILQYDVARWDGSDWRETGEEFRCEVTHWMPLPEPPK